jgi:glucose-1-phosphate cytidylyltransferase
MRVVLFCGGQGMRLREYSDAIPKPLVPIGSRPLLWWVMKYYAHFGHKDFVLALGYKGEAIKDYFLNYNECRSNDFVMTRGGKLIEPLRTDMEDWRITFVDTGLNSNVGERLMAVKPYLRGEDVFLANYADGLADAPLPELIDEFSAGNHVASFLSVRPGASFHFVQSQDDGSVTAIADVMGAGTWINGGYFVLRQEIFDYMRAGDELVVEPFHRLIAEGRLRTRRYEGFWRCVDTFKDLQSLESMYAKGNIPWELWRSPSGTVVPDARPADIWTEARPADAGAPAGKVPRRSAGPVAVEPLHPATAGART